MSRRTRLVNLEEDLARIAGQALLIASDFDGTLAPIVARPEDARGNERALASLQRLTAHAGFTVAIVSGRGLEDLERLASAVPGAVLIAEHGSVRSGDVVAPNPGIPELESVLRAIVDPIEGAIVEVKRQSVAFHYRLVSEAEAKDALSRLTDFVATRPALRVTEGKKVFEMSLASRDKGDAVLELAAEMGAKAILFIGDDITDENVFARLGANDLGVKVGDGPTSARHRVEDVEAVADLLDGLSDLVGGFDQAH